MFRWVLKRESVIWDIGYAPPITLLSPEWIYLIWVYIYHGPFINWTYEAHVFILRRSSGWRCLLARSNKSSPGWNGMETFRERQKIRPSGCLSFHPSNYHRYVILHTAPTPSSHPPLPMQPIFRILTQTITHGNKLKANSRICVYTVEN